uniref:UBA domain containing 2 n=1 Tax=Cyprinus carpio TaxID=7962 RepID=A0A8C1GC45_CYPCA
MLFTSTGSRGLYKAPLSKSLLPLPTVLTVLLTVFLPQYQDLLIHNLQVVRQGKQVRYYTMDLKDTFCSSLLIYNFQIFEGRFGSHKFASFLFGEWILSAFVDLLLTEALCFMFELKVDVLPAIPRVQVTQLLGHISVTNKSLTYIVGAQLLTSNAYMWVVVCSGLIAGVLYYSNKLAVQKFLRVPGCGSVLLEPVFSDSEPTAEASLGMGATLDIQRQQRMDMRNAQQQQAQVLLQHRGQNHEGTMRVPSNNSPTVLYMHPPDNTAVAEEQVRLYANHPSNTNFLIIQCFFFFFLCNPLWSTGKSQNNGH